jgi:hypothetical protein
VIIHKGRELDQTMKEARRKGTHRAEMDAFDKGTGVQREYAEDWVGFFFSTIQPGKPSTKAVEQPAEGEVRKATHNLVQMP